MKRASLPFVDVLLAAVALGVIAGAVMALVLAAPQ